MTDQISGIGHTFRKGYKDQANWQEKFAIEMHKKAEISMQEAIFQGQDFLPVVLLVNNTGFLVIPIREFTSSPENKNELAAQLHETARTDQKLIGIVMITDIWIRKTQDDPDPIDAIYTNSQWREHKTVELITRYVKKNDIETSFEIMEMPEYDLAIGRFSNFFNK